MRVILRSECLRPNDVSRILSTEDSFGLMSRPMGFSRIMRDSAPGPVSCSTWRMVPSTAGALIRRSTAGFTVRACVDERMVKHDSVSVLSLKKKIGKNNLYLRGKAHAKLLLFRDRAVLTSANGGEVSNGGRDEWWYSTDHPADLRRIKQVFFGYKSETPRVELPDKVGKKHDKLSWGFSPIQHDGGCVTVTPPGGSPLGTLISLMDGGDLTLCWWRPTVGFAQVMRTCRDLGLVKNLRFVLDDASSTGVKERKSKRDEGVRAIRELLPEADLVEVRHPHTVHLKLAAFDSGLVLLSSANWQMTSPAQEAYVLLDDKSAHNLVMNYYYERKCMEAPF